MVSSGSKESTNLNETHGISTVDPNVIEWNGPSDGEAPRNWSLRQRALQSILWALVVFVPSLTGGIYSSTVDAVSQRMGISNEAANLGTSLFILGNGFGPFLFGPLSERIGRKSPTVMGLFAASIFTIGTAAAMNTSTLMICRFFSGVFGIGPASCVSGGLADIWETRERGMIMTSIIGLFFVGSSLAPVFGNLIVASAGGWRWTLYFTAIFGFVASAATQSWMRESYELVLLSRRAARIRHETKNWAVRAKADEIPPTLEGTLNTYFIRPPVLLATEPKLAFLTVYTSLIWGLLFLYLETSPIAFQEVRGWPIVTASLPFISEAVGTILGVGMVISQILLKHGHKTENASSNRLQLMIIGGILLPIGLFWFAWTSDPNIIWVPQVISIAITATGLFLVYIQTLNYIVDFYPDVANSAIAANTSVRAMFASGFPLIALPFYHNLGVPWATSILGFICAAMVPLPILFVYRQKRQSRTG